MALAGGCTFHRSGSQAIVVDRNGARPADGWGYDNGQPLDHR
jgi:hypothetical protein